MSLKKIVIVGFGISGQRFLSTIDINKFDITILSPYTNYSFSPLLHLVCSGTLTTQAITDNINNYVYKGEKQVMTYYEGYATEVDIKNNKLIYESNGISSSLPYDYLILAPGSDANTFDIPGVLENSFTLKNIHNANDIYKNLLYITKQASSENIDTETKQKLLKIVIVGGGPSGVEVASELNDLKNTTIKQFYPNLFPYMSVTLLESKPYLLSQFSKSAQEYCIKSLTENDLNVKLSCTVREVTPDAICYKNKLEDDSVDSNISYGMLVWTAGIKPTNFTTKFIHSIEQQKGNKFIAVTPTLQVIGTKNIFAIGDCCNIVPPKLIDIIDKLYMEAKSYKSGPGSSFLQHKAEEGLDKIFPQIHKNKYDFTKKEEQNNLSYDDFYNYIKEVDNSYITPQATAIIALQVGPYLANCFNDYYFQNKSNENLNDSPAFVEALRGKQCYLGPKNIIIDTASGDTLTEDNFKRWKNVYFKVFQNRITQFHQKKDYLHKKMFGHYFPGVVSP